MGEEFIPSKEVAHNPAILPFPSPKSQGGRQRTKTKTTKTTIAKLDNKRREEKGRGGSVSREAMNPKNDQVRTGDTSYKVH